MVSAEAYAKTISTIYFTVYLLVFLIASFYCAYEVEEEHHIIRKKASPNASKLSKTNAGDTEPQPPLSLNITSANAEVATQDTLAATNQNLSCVKRWKKFGKYWMKSLWSKKKIYISIVPHIFDQATDLGVMYIYYEIWKHPEKYQWEHNRIDMAIVFRASVGVIVLHKVISCGAIYALTRSFYDVFLQFIDFMMLKAIYLNYKLNTEEPGNAQRYLQILEGTFEAGPQILISILYITKAYNPQNPPDPIILISVISSIWTLTSRVVSDDKLLLKDEWKPAFREGNKFPWINHLNWRYVVRVFCWRFCEISSRVFILVLLWVVVGGFAFAIIMTVEFCAVFILCFLGEGVIVLGNMLYYTMAAVHKVPYLVLESAATYKVASPFIFLILITIFCTVPFEAWKVDDFSARNEVTYVHFKLFMLVYSWIASVIWVTSVIYITLHSKSKQSSSRECDVLLLSKQWGELLNLIEFGAPVDKIYPTFIDKSNAQRDVFLYITAVSNFFAPRHKALVFANLYERDANIKIARPEMVLSYAVSDNFYLTKYLIETVGMETDDSILTEAVKSNQLRTVKYLIMTIGVNMKDTERCAAYILRHELYDILAHMLKRHEDFAKYCFKWATKYLQCDVVKCLMDNIKLLNIDVNHVDNKGESCLFWAVSGEVVIRDAPELGNDPLEYFEILDGRQKDRKRKKFDTVLKQKLLEFFVEELKLNWIIVNDQRKTLLQMVKPVTHQNIVSDYLKKLHVEKGEYSAHELLTLWGLSYFIPKMEEKGLMDTDKWAELVKDSNKNLAIEIFGKDDIKMQENDTEKKEDENDTGKKEDDENVDNENELNVDNESGTGQKEDAETVDINENELNATGKKEDNENDVENKDENDVGRDWIKLNKRTFFAEKYRQWLEVQDDKDALFQFLFLSPK